MSKEFKGQEHPDILVHWTGHDIDQKYSLISEAEI